MLSQNNYAVRNDQETNTTQITQNVYQSLLKSNRISYIPMTNYAS